MTRGEGKFLWAGAESPRTTGFASNLPRLRRDLAKLRDGSRLRGLRASQTVAKISRFATESTGEGAISRGIVAIPVSFTPTKPASVVRQRFSVAK